MKYLRKTLLIGLTALLGQSVADARDVTINGTTGESMSLIVVPSTYSGYEGTLVATAASNHVVQ